MICFYLLFAFFHSMIIVLDKLSGWWSMKKGKQVECKGLIGLSQKGVVARGNSIRLEFWYKGKQEKAKFCTLDKVNSNDDFQELLDEAFYELKSIKRKTRDGIFTDESYASSLPLSTFSQKRGGSRSSTNFYELAQKYLDDQAPLMRRGQIAGSTVRARRKNLITSAHMKPLDEMLSMPNEAKHPALIKHGLGDLLLGDITFEMLRKLQTYLYDYVPRIDGVPGLSEKTVNNFFDAIKQVFKYALQNEIIEKDPSVNIKTLKVKTKNKIENLDFFDLSQQSIVVKFCMNDDKPWLAELFIFGCWTGLRREELLALAWEDIDLVKNTIYVHRAYTREDDLHQTKNTGSVRVIELLDEARASLNRMFVLTGNAQRIDYQVLRPETSGRVTESLTMVFQNFAKGGPIPRRWLDGPCRNQWQRVMRLSGVPVPLSHPRHTSASMRVSANGRVEEVAQEMGHSDTSMMHRNYSVVTGKFNLQLLANKQKGMDALKSSLEYLK